MLQLYKDPRVFFYLMQSKLHALLYKTRNSYKTIPEKKQYVEFFTALLSVPFLLTVILLNINNLKANSTVKAVKESPQPSVVKEIIYIEPKNSSKTVQSNSIKPTERADSTVESRLNPTTIQCKKEVGPISIIAPKDGEVVTENPVNVIVRYESGEYCAVVWSYRINKGAWSEYDDKSIALFDLPNESILLELKVKSIVTGEEKLLQKSFINSISSEEKVSSISAQ